ncbi:hypothetical protein HNQ75_004572 [Rhizobium flavum]|uniref:Transposase n=1 Tax=Pseudorhizobium flavum TaxID=1335061 RepID=A0A7X0DF11_9HYPH|nr:hypothetical protein [Pseudorhizobium flavum]
MTDITIGADISKDHIDLHSLADDQTLKVANDRKGFAAIVRWIGTKGVARIVYEPTGPYHKAFERSWLQRGCRSPRSILALPGASVRPPAGSPRQTGSMPNSWPSTVSFFSRASCRPTRNFSMT